MADHADVEARITGLLKVTTRMTVEQLVARMPDMVWGQVLAAVKLLSERGEVVVQPRGFTCEVVRAPKRRGGRAAGSERAAGPGAFGKMVPKRIMA